MSKILLLGEYPTNADLKNKGSYSLITKVLDQYEDKDFKFAWLVNKVFSKDTTYKVSDKEYKEALDLEKTVKLIQKYKPDKIMIFGLRMLKVLTKEKTISSSINKPLKSHIPGIEADIYVNYSPNLIANHYDDYITPFVNIFEIVFNDFELKTNTKYELIHTIKDFNKFIKTLDNYELFCFDFETTGLEYYDDEIIPTLLSISLQCGYSYVIPLFHYQSKFSEDDVIYIFSELDKHVFKNNRLIKIGHNISFDLHFIKRYCTDVLKGLYFDTMLMHHLLDENTRHGLKELTKVYFPAYVGYDKIVDWVNTPLDELAAYASIDTDLTLRLFIQFENKLIIDDKLSSLYVLLRNFTMPAMQLLNKMEHHGAKIDIDYIIKSIDYANNYAETIKSKLLDFKDVRRFSKLESESIREAKLSELREKQLNAKTDSSKNLYSNKINEVLEYDFKYEINFDSPKQLNKLLFSKEGFSFPKFFDTWENVYKETTSREHLKTIKHEFIDLLLAYRTVTKMVSTYYEGILKRVDKHGFLHSSFLLHGTVTGRLSSRNPNLQNIPNRTQSIYPEVQDIFKRVKKFFVTKDDEHIIVAADYSQAELRTIANFSGDENMIDAYLSGKDLHAITGSKIARVSLEEFYAFDKFKFDSIRGFAKNANFCLIYNATIKTYILYVKELSGVELSDKEANSHHNALFVAFPKLKDWHKLYVKKAYKFNYVRTLFKRKRRLLNLHNTNPRLVSADERVAINAPIQGTCGEWTIFTSILLDKILPKDVVFFNTVHDAIYYYVPKINKELIISCIDDIASNTPIAEFFSIDENRFKVPMKLDFGISEKSWGEVEDYKL